ncbi:MAG: exodeoxyribonuclease VII large subunit [Hyphomicrobiales bacterium]
MADGDITNATEYSVSEVSHAVKRTVEDAFGYVRVRGEISGFRGQHGSGHAYFSMKDEKARLEAVIWKGVYNRLKVKPEEGLEVIATGKITTYPGSSKYQIVIESLEPAGVGALMALLEERKKKLAAEGLFDPARKQLLPYLPRVIGVITSPTGAVIRDIMHRLEDRFPTHVLLWPARVQGETCGQEVANAIRGFNAFDGTNGLVKPDVLIVARGGGSLEDLWGFNDEEVVRAAADSHIPLISAVGHETDWTLIDYAADVRAPTPTGAAEMAVRVRTDLLATLDDLNQRNKGAIGRHLENRKNHLRGLARALPKPENLLALNRQRLDDASDRLPRAANNRLREAQGRLERIAAKHSIDAFALKISQHRQGLNNQSQQLGNALERRAAREQNKLSTLTARLSPSSLSRQLSQYKTDVANLDERGKRASTILLNNKRADWQRLSRTLSLVSYQSVLTRGFALVRDEAGKPVRSATAIKAGASYAVQLADGHADVIGKGGTTPPMGAKPKQTTDKKPSTTQGSLF